MKNRLIDRGLPSSRSAQFRLLLPRTLSGQIDGRVVGRIVCRVVCLILCLLFVPQVVAEEVVIDRCDPARSDGFLVCTLSTRGLPGMSSRETLASGLPSALIIDFSVLDESGEELGQTRSVIRIEPDLWEQVFILRTPLLDLRLESLAAVESSLASLGPLPVLPLEEIVPGRPLRVRARLAIHPLAREEILRVQALFTGEPEGPEPDRREISVGLGTLLRYFISGDPDEEWVTESFSRHFSLGTLEEAQ